MAVKSGRNFSNKGHLFLKMQHGKQWVHHYAPGSIPHGGHNRSPCLLAQVHQLSLPSF